MFLENNEKYEIVIKKNTFYYFDDDFENDYESHIFSVKEAIIHLKNSVLAHSCTKDVFLNFLEEKQGLGLRALLAITGFSNESLKRLITVIRIIDDPSLEKISNKSKWNENLSENEIGEWGLTTIEKLISDNSYFRQCIINIFYDGSASQVFKRILPPFEFHKLSIEKLNFETNALIDTLARYKEKGSRAAKKKNNAESLLDTLLNRLNIPHESGDLYELIENAFETKRTMDFIIPSKRNPKVIIESSFVVTTSSAQGDKAKTEIEVRELLKKHYPKAAFIGFVDGIGWYVRKRDLQRLVSAFDDVFTYHPDELLRFEKYILKVWREHDEL
jgi:hypothetical protein